MNQDLQTVKTDAITIFKSNIARQEREFRAALPVHIPVERFVRVLTTAVVNNPALLDADRRSLFLSALRAAQDGLLPDGREGALVTFGNKVQWMPMVAGILKKVRNSGELLSIAAHVAYSNDEFAYELGDEEKISHRPALDDRGKPRLVYAIAKTKDGGIYREIMTVADVEKVRAISRAKDSGPWVSWWGEMARKTVLRRLSKRLPMSSDIDGMIGREGYDFEGESTDAGSVNHLAARGMAETPTDRLTADLDAIAAGSNGDPPLSHAIAEIRNVMDAPPHDPETGEIIEHPADAFRHLQEKHIIETLKNGDAPAEADASDPKLQSLLDAGRAAATNGTAKYRKWENNIPVPSFALIKPHLEELRKAAGMADGGVA
jgi:recombination protein RecT